MNVIKTSGNLTNRDQYKLTKAANIGKMADCAGQTLELAAWIIYEDYQADGTLKTIVAVVTTDGESFATNSATFVRDFMDMTDFFAPEEMKRITVATGRSRAGRTFINAVLAD